MKPCLVRRTSIDPDVDQPRRAMDQEELENLASSIRSRGMLQPPVLYRHEDRLITVDGHRRIAAAGMAGVEEFLALVLPAKPSPDEALLMQLAANSLRSDLKPSEQAASFQKLQQMKGWNHAQLAEAMHISKGTVTQILSLLTLPLEAQAMVDSGKLAKSTAYAISREQDESRRSEMLQMAAQGELKRDDAARQVSQRPRVRPKVRSAFRVADAEVIVVTEEDIGVDGCLAILQQLCSECRRAAKQALNVKTLESILADKAGTEA